MDIKVSRFDNGAKHNHLIEEMIPNEEPLIQVRQISGMQN